MSDKVTEDEAEAPSGEGEEVSHDTLPDVELPADDGDSGDDDDAGIAIEVDASDVADDPDSDEITDPDGADVTAALEARVAALEAEKKETYDRLLRATADLDNFRKRSRRDLADGKADAKKNVLGHMLPVVDNLERALAHAEGGGDVSVESILEGVKLVLRQFTQAFERCDVVGFDSIGQAFDPNIHEAVGQIETDEQPPGAVAQELQRGYKLGERLLRPALVVVAKPPADPPAAGPNGHDTDADSGGDAATEAESGEAED